ncbi:hypothetical protein K438DRAFT_1964022 [Mycena galopus ATCC 62051]|nr:hypothetical protein K438DRAFT_1964022 [Mycena galopus ATCC 62051]
MFHLQFLALALTAVIPQIIATPTPALITLPYPLLPQSSPAPAVILGVDSQGHTTYALEEDILELGASAPTTTFPATATLVAGTDHAFLTYSASADGLAIALGLDCEFQSGNAICSGLDLSSQAQTTTIPFASQASGAPFVLDVVSTAAPSGPTNKSNSSPKLLASISGAIASSVLAAAYVLL